MSVLKEVRNNDRTAAVKQPFRIEIAEISVHIRLPLMLFNKGINKLIKKWGTGHRETLHFFKDSTLTDVSGGTSLCMLHSCRSQKQQHKSKNKRAVCYISTSLVLLPALHNECSRHALSIVIERQMNRGSSYTATRAGV